MIPLKRRKVSLPVNQQNDTCKFPHVSIFILERKMGASRRAFLTRLGRSKGFLIEEIYSSSITHVVSENNSGDEVQAWLGNQTGQDTSSSVHLLDIRWFTESMDAGQPVIIQDRHILKVKPKPDGDHTAMLLKSYACQRRTPLKHHNSFLTEALEILAQNAEYNDNEGRSVAFRRAASVLKALPRRVRSMEDLRCLPCLGDHSQRVIKEILEDGSSREVESTRQSEQYQAMKALTGIFGVGVRTADRWFREGLRSPDDLIRTGQQLNRAQQAGVQYYDDLQKPVTMAEADVISDIVEKAVHSVLPGAEIQLMGGFRRGKEFGHDVDFIIKTFESGQEDVILAAVIQRFKSQNILLYSDLQESTFDLRQLPTHRFEAMDHFSKCFLIVKLKREPEPDSGAGRDWRAVRVDLLAPPLERFAYALLGWTGSTLFERDLRRFARLERGKLLDNHALYDKATNSFLSADTEEDIFAHLGLEYIEPRQRNA
ncbi:DNA nucleotidylexotransferase-like isoform X2 [Puntigrus tetrazona]|uniref:DNA nucleotidylexotransferase-like isoform X2 n=1 Tax=Puntigrus tetrazona TaxID=1606681 RepID=UPI001C8A6785|nr:DNA nucleotidylexotransferase-like isoform X2 [Puntigrus tetrazona]